MAWVLLVRLRFFPLRRSLESLDLVIIPPFMAIGFVMVAFVLFRFRYGRNFTYGVVEQMRRGKVVVRVGYDICSNVKAGIYVVDSFVKVKRGERVKLSVERPFLGLKGSRVVAVIEKA
ncbi:MAG: DUF2101 family protein [Candidatus Hadarchaeales archaeon]